MTSDTNYLELDQTSRVKFIVVHKTALTSDTGHEFGESQATPTFDHLSANSWVPTTSSSLIIHENELRKMLCL